MLNRYVCMFVLAAAACASSDRAPETPKVAPATPGQPAFVGHWIRDLGNGERYLMHLFSNGIAAFQHVGEELPISRSYGRWSTSGNELVLSMFDDLPERPFPLANHLLVSVGADATSLTITGNGESTAWSAHDTYGVARAGWQERAARGEQSWTSMVERAEQNAGKPVSP